MIGILLPIITFLLIYSLPVKSLESDKEQSDKLPTDFYMVKTTACVIILCLACCCLTCVMCGSNFTTPLSGARIDSVSVRELKQ